MSSRDEVFQSVTDKHTRTMDNLHRTIQNADTVLSARDALEAAVRSLPGVSSDPDTVPDILNLMDSYNVRVSPTL